MNVLEEKVAKETLRYHVARQMTCQITGRVLDVKTSILVEVEMKSGNRVSQVYHEDHDVNTMIENLRTLANVKDITVTDGRTLFARKAARGKE